MSRSTPTRASAERSAGNPRGIWLVTGLLVLGLAAAFTGVWFQREQTRRCLEFYGPTAARRIAAAPTVELLLVQPGTTPRRLEGHRRIDVSKAPGLVHLRRGLVEDANFNWQSRGGGNAATVTEPLPIDAWDVAFVFTNPGPADAAVPSGDQGRTTLVIDLDSSGGSLAVVGQPG